MPYHTLSVSKTVRYHTAGPEPRDAKGVLIALHGYGQLPEFFLRRFAPLAEAGWAVIAPEAMHRFYLNGTHGRVGASWMTKEAREDDIRDYVHYLDTLAAHLDMAHHQPVLLGFSQGVATASRWVALGSTGFQRLVLWAGTFPPDYPWERDNDRLKHLPIDVAIGSDDPYFDNGFLRTTEEVLGANGVTFTAHSFAGGHEIEPQLILQLLS